MSSTHIQNELPSAAATGPRGAVNRSGSNCNACGRFRPGVRKRINSFFDANPDEELTRGDMVEKFGLSIRTIEQALKEMKEAGELEPAHVWRRPIASR